MVMTFLKIFPQESFISMLRISMSNFPQKVKFRAAISENRGLERKCHISFWFWHLISISRSLL